MTQKTALYIHIPFCNKICPFCDFTKQKTNKDLFQSYLNALKKNINYYKNEKIKLTSIYFGGGTPSTFPTILIKDLIDYIYSIFPISKNIEISFEMNPEDVTLTYINKIKKIGINRISIGVQSFHDDECEFLGRNHNTNKSKHALNIIKNEIENFNIDLMFALPNSSINSLDYSLTKALSYEPKHLSCYSLTIEPNTPFHTKNITKSNQDENQYKYIINELKKLGYNQYEISSFAKPNYKCKHNQNYWDFKDYIGIGTGAHSLYKNKKFKKNSSINYYISNPSKYEITCNTTKDLIMENIIANLRRLKGLSYRDYKIKYDLEFKIKYSNTLKFLQKNKLVTLNSTGLKVTKKGLYLLDDVCLSFL